MNKAFTQADAELRAAAIGIKSATVAAQVRSVREGEVGVSLCVISASDNLSSETLSQITVTLERPKTPSSTLTSSIDDVYGDLVAAIKGAASAAKTAKANAIPSLELTKVSAEIAFTVARKTGASAAIVISVLGIGARGSEIRSAAHKISVEFEPRSPI